MKFLKIIGLLLTTSSTLLAMSLGDSTARSAFKQLEVLPSQKNDGTNDVNPPSIDILDVRTPPKVKQQQEIFNKHLAVEFEASHAGIAIPVVDEVILEDSTTPKSIKSTTATSSTGGLSTWILLSGQSSGTTKAPTRKPVIKPVTQNETLVVNDKPQRFVKPIFKKKSTTLRPKTTTTTTTTASTKSSTTSANKNQTVTTTSKPSKITNKIKASVLNNAINKKNHTVLVKKTNTTTLIAITTHKPVVENVNKTTTVAPKNKESTTKKTSLNKTDSSTLPVEAKDEETDLPADDKKKNKNKKKKNKNRKRKPAKEHKETTSLLEATKPVSTQLYSYLRSEIIPVTVGVSLVGLLVTAGLASYYLQPFGLLRRSDTPIDRKDPPGEYYYQDQYSGGIPEEDAIGKVIAGMPEDVLQGTNYKSPTTRSSQFVTPNNNNNNKNNIRYRHVDRRSQIHINPYGTVEDVKLSDQTMYGSNSQNQYVVGNVPKEVVQEVTPAAVPEHGPRNLKEERQFVVGSLPKEYVRPGGSPRNLKIRRRRDAAVSDKENEITNEPVSSIGKDENVETPSTTPMVITTEKVISTTANQTIESLKNESAAAIIDLFTDIFRMKLQLGFELVQNITQGVNTYLSAVENKLSQFNETTTITPNARKFVNVHKRFRFKRDTMVNDNENEIFSGENFDSKYPKSEYVTTTDKVLETTTESISTTTTGIWQVNEKRPTVMELLKELFRTKLRMGLEFIGTVSRSVSSYVEKVQSRLNEHYHVMRNDVQSKEEGSKPRR